MSTVEIEFSIIGVVTQEVNITHPDYSLDNIDKDDEEAYEERLLKLQNDLENGTLSTTTWFNRVDMEDSEIIRLSDDAVIGTITRQSIEGEYTEFEASEY